MGGPAWRDVRHGALGGTAFFFSLSALQGEERCNERHGVTRLRAAGAGNEEVCRSGRGGGRMPGEGRQNALPRLEEGEKKKKAEVFIKLPSLLFLE